MRWRDQLALTLPALILRVVLAVTFLWAGTGKLVGTTLVSGDDAARLANLGVTLSVPEPEPDATPDAPAPSEALPEETIVPEEGDAPEQENMTDDASEAADDTPDALSMLAPRVTRVQDAHSPAVGSDFPEPREVRRVYSVALLLDTCANPGLTEDSTPITPLVPEWLGRGNTPIIAAWAAAITELLAGFLLLIGLLTRIGAVSIMSVMLVAMWTTTIGPAAVHSSDAILGFIPRASDVWAPQSYTVVLWQFALVGVSLAVILLGPGPLSVDRVLFRGSRDPYAGSRPKGRMRKSGDAPDPNP